MFGIGMPELLVILVVALFIVGPKKLPGMAKNLGRGLAELKRSANDVVSNVTDNEDFKDLKEIKNSLNDAAAIVRDPLDAVTSSIKDDLNQTIDLEPEQPKYLMEPHGDPESEAVAETINADTDPSADVVAGPLAESGPDPDEEPAVLLQDSPQLAETAETEAAEPEISESASPETVDTETHSAEPETAEPVSTEPETAEPKATASAQSQEKEHA